MNEIDFRLIPISKAHSKFYNEEIYKIPCKVLRVGNRLKGKIFNLEIEILDFVTGELVNVTAKTYEGSLQYFQNLPITSACDVRKLGYCHIDLFVYGHFNVGIFEAFFEVDEILNHDEEEIFKLYNDYYKPLREWIGLGSNEKYSFENNEDDLPF